MPPSASWSNEMPALRSGFSASITDTSIKGASCGNFRLALEPGLGFFQLRTQPDQRRLVAEASRQLHCQWQPTRALAERQHQRRLAGEIEPDCKRRKIKDAAPVLV